MSSEPRPSWQGACLLWRWEGRQHLGERRESKQACTCLRYLLLAQSGLPASGLGGQEPFLGAGSGAPLLGGARLRVQVSQVGDLQLARRQAVEARRRGWRGSWPSGAYKLATGHKENSTRHSGTRHVVRATDASSKDQHPKQNVTPNAGSWAGKALWLCTDHFTVYILLERRESTHTGNMLGAALNAR